MAEKLHRVLYCDNSSAECVTAKVAQDGYHEPLAGRDTDIVNNVAPTDIVQFTAEEGDVVEVEVGEYITDGQRWTGIIDWAPAEVSSGVPVLRMSRIPAVWYGKDLRLHVRLSRSRPMVYMYVFVIRVPGK